MSGIQHMLLGAVKKSGLGNGDFLANLTGVTYLNNYFPKAIANDQYGDTIVVGTGYNAFTVNKSNTVVAKYNSLGVLQWQKAYGAAGENNEGTAVTVDFFGNIYIAVKVEAGSYLGAAVVKLDPNGVLQWTYLYYYTDRNIIISSIVADTSSYVYMSGWWLTDSGNRGGLITGTTTSGNNYATYGFTYSGSTTYEIKGIAIDSGSIYVVGNTIVSGATPEGILLKLNRSTFGLTSIRKLNPRSGWSLYLNDITVDSSGNIYIAGSTSYSSSSYVVKLSSSFSVLWDKEFFSGLYQFRSISKNNNNEIILIGDDGGSTYGYMVNLNETNGNINWQRFYQMTSPAGNLTQGSLTISSYDSSKYYFSYRSFVSGVGNFWSYGRLPMDGTKTGTYVVGSYTYSYNPSGIPTQTPPSWSLDFVGNSVIGSPVDTISIGRSVVNTSYTSTVLQ